MVSRWARHIAVTGVYVPLAVIPLSPLPHALPVTVYQDVAATEAVEASATQQEQLEWRTDSVVIVYAPSSGAAAEELAGLADATLAGLTSALSVTLPTPITVRLHATRADLLEAVPLAAEIDGMLVTSPRAARELHLVAADGLLRDNLRQALGRLTATTLGAGAVPDLWASGFADFLTRPTDTRATGVARLRTARDAGQLHPWTNLGAAGGAFLDPSVTHPQALSAITFLAEQGGVAALRRFLEEMGKGLAWPAAMQSAYGLPAADLETAWRGWLDGYFNGGWRRHALYPADTAALEAMLGQGRYREAAEAARAADGFAGVDDPDLGLALRSVGTRAHGRTGARQGVAAAFAALNDGRYADALVLADAANAEIAGDSAAAEAAAELRRRAGMGVAAEADLDSAANAALWQAPLAALRAVRARASLAALGSETGARRAQEQKARFDRVLVPLGGALVSLGGVVLGRNAWRRRHEAAG